MLTTLVAIAAYGALPVRDGFPCSYESTTHKLLSASVVIPDKKARLSICSSRRGVTLCVPQRNNCLYFSNLARV